VQVCNLVQCARVSVHFMVHIQISNVCDVCVCKCVRVFVCVYACACGWVGVLHVWVYGEHSRNA